MKRINYAFIAILMALLFVSPKAVDAYTSRSDANHIANIAGKSNGDVLTLDGKWMEWTDPATGLNAPGSNNEVIFNKDGVLGADAGLYYVKATGDLLCGIFTTTTGSIGSATFMTAGTYVDSGTYISSGSYLSSGAHILATTYIHADTYVEANEDFRLVSLTADVGGGLRRTKSEATSGVLSGASGTIQVNVPTGSRVLGVQLRVDTAITGPVIFTAAYSGGLTQVIGVSPVAKNSKILVMYDTNTDDDRASAEVDILLTATPNFNDGGVFAVVYYEIMIPLDDAP